MFTFRRVLLLVDKHFKKGKVYIETKKVSRDELVVEDVVEGVQTKTREHERDRVKLFLTRKSW